MKTPFDASEDDGIWFVNHGDLPIGRALTQRDAQAFVDALNGVLGNDLRDRIIDAVHDAIEGCFD